MALALLLLLFGCRSYVPVESVRTEYRTRDSVRYDSIYLHDSIYVQTIADTVYLYKYRDQYRYKYIDKVDTVMVCDTIQVPVLIEKPSSRWGISFSNLATLGFIVLVIILGGRLRIL